MSKPIQRPFFYSSHWERCYSINFFKRYILKRNNLIHLHELRRLVDTPDHSYSIEWRTFSKIVRIKNNKIRIDWKIKRMPKMSDFPKGYCLFLIHEHVLSPFEGLLCVWHFVCLLNPKFNTKTIGMITSSCNEYECNFLCNTTAIRGDAMHRWRPFGFAVLRSSQKGHPSNLLWRTLCAASIHWRNRPSTQHTHTKNSKRIKMNSLLTSTVSVFVSATVAAIVRWVYECTHT